MFIIGLTGNIGTGKTTVAEILEELGATRLDADKIGHEILVKDLNLRQELVLSFGSGILDEDFTVDRKKLGEVVFNQPEKLALLNRLMHDPIKKLTLQKMDEVRQKGVKMLVLEVPLLIEAGWLGMVDEVWVTHAPEEVILERITRRDNATRDQVLARLSSQMPQAEKVKKAQVAINTDLNLTELREKVRNLFMDRIKL